ncbi:hypothetical protein CWS43_26050 [Rahnella sp. AA]|uniref:hypothetical protein n=1 Tax=Rahnella sp. AA TaxID=2057180 RepID=UPI000C34BE08|nr:hypothetical protein [Rahnella sp. AA]PKE27589.1 hypothetical protein CWS43_26050 [Rahnella sp. AA]
MILFQTRKRVLFWGWAVMLFAGVRLVLSVPLRSQWGPQQLTDAYTANLCSLVALVGVILPLVPERKRVAALGLMLFIRFAGRYLVLSHLLVALLTAFIAVSFSLCWSTPLQGSGLLVFIASCVWVSRLTLKDNKTSSSSR